MWVWSKGENIQNQSYLRQSITENQAIKRHINREITLIKYLLH